MPEYMVLKRDLTKNPPWVPTQIVSVVKQPDDMTVDDWRQVVRQGYSGDGRYSLCRWDSHRESNLSRPAIPDVEDL